MTYSDGPQNCEAIAVDPVRNNIILIAKTTLVPAGVYIVPLPKLGDTESNDKSKIELQADRIGSLPIGMITAMDLEPKSGDICLVNYFHAYYFPCGSNRKCTLTDQIHRTPKQIELPKWKQIEAVAFDDEKRIWLSSEGSPAPFGRLKKKP